MSQQKITIKRGRMKIMITNKTAAKITKKLTD
jgi:hypothetical protein